MRRARRPSACWRNPARLLSVTQVGVTLSSLGLGWAGEETVFRIIQSFFHPNWGRYGASHHARRQSAGGVSGNQLPARSDRRSGAQESGDRRRRPPGGNRGARAAGFLPDFHRVRGGDRAIERRHYQYAAGRRAAPVGRPFGGGVETDRDVQPWAGVSAGGAGRHDPSRAGSERTLRARNHGAAQRYHFGIGGSHTGRGFPRHDRAPALPPAGLRREARADRGTAALQRSAARSGRSGAKRYGRGRPSRTFRIRRLLRKHLVVPETKPVGPDAGRNSKRGGRTWRWWWTNSGRSPDC